MDSKRNHVYWDGTIYKLFYKLNYLIYRYDDHIFLGEKKDKLERGKSERGSLE